jgi:ribosome biogenesis GTPase
MKLEELGYNADLEKYRMEKELGSLAVGRVVSEHRERYRVRTELSECDAEILGNLRFAARSRSDFPAVGDWVAVSAYDTDKLLIHHIFPRKSIIERSAVGSIGEKQLIATNIDYALIMQAVDRDFSLNRIERYLAICDHSGIIPVILITKTDLVTSEELGRIFDLLERRLKGHRVVAISNETRSGYDQLTNYLFKGMTYCLLGSSGVGKSTLINNLSGEGVSKTGSIGSRTQRGRHMTTSRELYLLREGAILIDNPGMREVGTADATEGLKNVYHMILGYSEECRYTNCTHTHEKGCAVKVAVERGEIENEVYLNYLRIKKEQDYFESSVMEKRKREKEFGKIMKNYKKTTRKNENE